MACLNPAETKCCKGKEMSGLLARGSKALGSASVAEEE